MPPLGHRSASGLEAWAFRLQHNERPLERISDVATSRMFWEKICGVGGLVMKEMGAVPKYGYPYYYGAGWGFPTMTAVPDPEEMQRRILELVGKKGKESKLAV